MESMRRYSLFLWLVIFSAVVVLLGRHFGRELVFSLVGVLPWLYYAVLRRLRKLAWQSAQNLPVTGKPLLAGAACGWKWQGLHQIAVHRPMYYLRVASVALAFPFTWLRFMWSRAWTPRGQGVAVEDHHVMAVVTETVFVLIAELDGGQLTLHLPSDLPLEEHHTFCTETPHGARVAGSGLTLVMDVPSRTIESATIEVEGIRQDVTETPGVSRNEILMSALAVAHAAWCHTTSHCLAEASAREIGSKQISVLEPSSRFTVSLHEGLLWAPYSAISLEDQPLHVGMHIEALRKACRVIPTPQHDLNPRKAEMFPMFRFWMTGHELLRRLVKKYELDVSSEALFQNLVLHSPDHCALFRTLTAPPLWSFDGSGTLRSYVRTYVFNHFWLLPLFNPFEPERVSEMTHPFYQKLYQGLSADNPERADELVTSCSF
jgi:hypothetical protein